MQLLSAEAVTKSGAEKLLDLQRYGFWLRTKRPPFRAVRWEAQAHEDGRQSFRGRNWVEVLPQGATWEAERFFSADIEAAGPHEWLTYLPGTREPVCGWGKPRLPDGEMQYCPRSRTDDNAFCRLHMAEMARGEEKDAREEAKRPHAQ